MTSILCIDRQPLGPRFGRTCGLFLLTIAIGSTALGATKPDASAKPARLGLSLSWRLLDNLPDERFLSEIELRNDREQVLENGWALYFNCGRKLLADSVGKDFELRRVNGDLYVLRPTSTNKALGAGEHRTIPLTGSLWAINLSDAPSGVFIVEQERSGKLSAPVAVPLDLQPFPENSKLRRGAADVVPVATAESRYAENELLTKLPGEELTKVVPTPKEVISMDGRVVVNSSTKIFYQAALRNEARFLASALGELLNGQLAIEEELPGVVVPVGSIRLGVGEVKAAKPDGEVGGESYMLTAQPDVGIEIVGSDSAGVFYGIQTLRSLLPVELYRQKQNDVSIDAVMVVDSPRFRYRGVHLDVARNFQKRETVEKLLDLMAFYKLNRLHLHLTDDEGWRLEVKQLPELTAVGAHRGHTVGENEHLSPSLGSGPRPSADESAGSGYYTQDDFVKLLTYAKERHISIVPELDLPGHARAAIKSLEARHRSSQQPLLGRRGEAFLLREPNDSSKYESVQMWNDNVVDVGRDDTYRFVDLVVGELSNMYKLAGVALTSIHLGGDEVPNGVWEKSPACQKLGLNSSSPISRKGQLELHFLDHAAEVLNRRSIQPACWEDCLLLETTQDSEAGDNRRATGKPVPTAYVWNTVWGWGREDAAYKLANAGFDVVLCNATNLYFDLACEKDPLELGYYWAGFVSMRAPFEFVPLDLYKNAEQTSMGKPVREEDYADRTRLTSAGADHILGIQGQLWGENLRSSQALEYMAFPRIIALAERAWASSPEWAEIADRSARKLKLEHDWNQFANRLGQRELPRLDFLADGVRYRLPPPGAVVRDGRVSANVAFPGLAIRYTTDGSEPDQSAVLFQQPVPQSSQIKLRSFDSRGRGSRTVNVGVRN